MLAVIKNSVLSVYIDKDSSHKEEFCGEADVIDCKGIQNNYRNMSLNKVALVDERMNKVYVYDIDPDETDVRSYLHELGFHNMNECVVRIITKIMTFKGDNLINMEMFR